jgi:hypothetical protein
MKNTQKQLLLLMKPKSLSNTWVLVHHLPNSSQDSKLSKRDSKQTKYTVPYSNLS